MNRFGLILFLITFGALCAKSDQLYDNGAPGLLDGAEMTRWRDADRFSTNETVTLSSVRFWDLQAAPNAFHGSVHWEIRANGPANTPGIRLHLGTSTNLTRVATGRVAFVVFPEFVTTFDVPSITLPPGTYWLVLHNGPLSNSGSEDLYWEEAINVGTEPSFNDQVPFTDVWHSNGVPSKLAFQLFGITQAAAPRVTAVDRANQVPNVTFTTAAGHHYRLEYKNILIETPWTPVPGAESIPGNGSPIRVSDPEANAQNVPRRYYRVVLVPSPPPPPANLLGRAPATSAPSESAPAAPNSLRARISLRSSGK